MYPPHVQPAETARSGLVAALVSSALGGSAIVATRLVTDTVDPVLLGVLRFGIGAVILLPVALLSRQPWPRGRLLVPTMALGVLFFGAFPLLFNASLVFTTAARGALALSTLPLLAMLVSRILGRERIDARRLVGILVAIGGVGLALAANLGSSPPEAWIGDLLMVAAAITMAVYTVLSKPVIAATGPLSFTTVAMSTGAVSLAVVSAIGGGLPAVVDIRPDDWIPLLYLGTFCGGILFLLWSVAVGRTSPVLVALSIVVNPIVALLCGPLLLGEEFHPVILVGIACVTAGIALASTSRRDRRSVGQ